MKQVIDLHTHSTASDGTLAPAKLVEKAVDVGLHAVAVTDHDTIDGLAEAVGQGEEIGMEVVPGVELSTDLDDSTVHILGYFVDAENRNLQDKLAWAKSVRDQRNDTIVERFNELGIDLTVEEVKSQAGGKIVGRPHFARVLVDKGAVSTMQEAFDHYLDRHTGQAYVPKFRFTPEESVGMILEAGGLPVLAHPGIYKWTKQQLDRALEVLCSLGLLGIEVLYSEHTPDQVELFFNQARRHGLLPTGGTDFHGQNKPAIELGKGKGNLSIPYSFLDDMKISKHK